MKLNVAVFFGGETVEHEVSIISAHQALEALDRNKYEVTPVYIAKDRTMYRKRSQSCMQAYAGCTTEKNVPGWQRSLN